MPNWCLNTLRINGDPQQIARLPWLETKSLLLQPLIPRPENLTPEKQHRWAIEHWGVKWDCSVEVVDCTSDYLELQFYTPWKSPFNGMNTISSMFPNLSFEMRSSESGNDWQESCHWRDGHLIQKITGHYFQQSSLKCPECQEDYYPEIDLNGNIVYSECSECVWSE